MRPPERIPKLVLVLMQIWTKFPDLRLGQMILNTVTSEDHKAAWDKFIRDVGWTDDDPRVAIAFDEGYRAGRGHGEMYNREDDVMMDRLREIYNLPPLP